MLQHLAYYREHPLSFLQRTDINYCFPTCISPFEFKHPIWGSWDSYVTSITTQLLNHQPLIHHHTSKQAPYFDVDLTILYLSRLATNSGLFPTNVMQLPCMCKPNNPLFADSLSGISSPPLLLISPCLASCLGSKALQYLSPWSCIASAHGFVHPMHCFSPSLRPMPLVHITALPQSNLMHQYLSYLLVLMKSCHPHDFNYCHGSSTLTLLPMNWHPWCSSCKRLATPCTCQGIVCHAQHAHVMW